MAEKPRNTGLYISVLNNKASINLTQVGDHQALDIDIQNCGIIGALQDFFIETFPGSMISGRIVTVVGAENISKLVTWGLEFDGVEQFKEQGAGPSL